MHASDCPICRRLKDVEASFSKYGAPEYDRPLPPAASELEIVPILGENAEKSHMRRCPSCGTLYAYSFAYEYLVNGSEDEETLTRLTPTEAAAFYRNEARSLENLRRDIDSLESSAGALGDYIDRGHPLPSDADAAFDRMQGQRREAVLARERLNAQVETFRRCCLEILIIWADAHVRVCRSFLAAFADGSPAPGFDASTARYVARTTLEAWEALPWRGDTFISIHTAFLSGYLGLLGAELEDPKG